MRRYLNLWGSFFANSLTRDMEYKANLIGGIIVDVIFYSVQYFFFSIIYSYVDTLGSFTREDVMVFLIITFISDTVYMFLFSGNLFPLNRLVVQGDLDFVFYDYSGFPHIGVQPRHVVIHPQTYRSRV